MTDFIPPSNPQDHTRQIHEWGTRPERDPRIQIARPDSQKATDGSPPVTYHEPRYPRRSLAVTAMIFSVLGFVSFGILGIVGIFLARSDLTWIENRATDPRFHDLAQAAFVVGLISVLLSFSFGAFLTIVALFATAG